jgi:hypothetical protein
MENSERFKTWQHDLFYLENMYDLKTDIPVNIQIGLLSRIKTATGAIPEELVYMLGKKKGKSLVHFLKSTAGTIIEIQKLLSKYLSLKLINISEYHILSESLLELVELLKAMDHTFKLKTSNPDQSADKSKSTGYWVLN